MKKKLAASFLSVAFSLALVGAALAQTESSARCLVNGREVPCEELAAKAKAFAGYGLGALVVGFVVFVLATIFWIMMIVHAASHDIPNKAMWIILMIFTGIIGALIYYFAVKRKFAATPKAPSAA